jgi:hypothetical protein
VVDVLRKSIVAGKVEINKGFVRARIGLLAISWKERKHMWPRNIAFVACRVDVGLHRRAVVVDLSLRNSNDFGKRFGQVDYRFSCTVGRNRDQACIEGVVKSCARENHRLEQIACSGWCEAELPVHEILVAGAVKETNIRHVELRDLAISRGSRSGREGNFSVATVESVVSRANAGEPEVGGSHAKALIEAMNGTNPNNQQPVAPVYLVQSREQAESPNDAANTEADTIKCNTTSGPAK